MKIFLVLFIVFQISYVSGASWNYQVNLNNNPGPVQKIDQAQTHFEAGPHDCEISQIVVNNNTQYRTLACAMGSGTVSTGGFCTGRGHQFPAVQYAILNLIGPKSLVNIVVACDFN